ncbi:MAG: hypothetical protein ACWA6X_00205 [Bauldia sp.]
MTRLTDRHHAALESLVRRLDPTGTATIADIDAVAAEIADLDDHDLDRIAAPHLDADPAGQHPALAYVRLIEPPHIVRWYETHSSGWPPADLNEHDAPAPQRRSVALAGRDVQPGMLDPGDPSRPATPIQRRRLTVPEEFP